MHKPAADTRHVGTRFSFTTLYGLPGWVLLASVFAIGCALVAVSAALAHERMRQLDGAGRFVGAACATSGDPAGATDWVAFYDDPMRHMSPCNDTEAKTAGVAAAAMSAAR